MNNSKSKSPGLAAILSLVIPGVGQFYNGTFGGNILADRHSWIMDRFRWHSWLDLSRYCAITAYNYAKRSDDDYRKHAGAEFMKKEENFDI